MSARTILKHVYENGGMTEYQYERIDRVLKERERPHGEWIERDVRNVFGETMKAYECSNCKRKNIGDVWIMMKLNFCPNCGADMREAGDELSNMKYYVCCPMCDKDKCVRGTEECDAEKWEKVKKGDGE